jgi:hypothetical protein
MVINRRNCNFVSIGKPMLGDERSEKRMRPSEDSEGKDHV